MKTYYAISQNGSLSMGSEFMRNAFKKFLTNNNGARIALTAVLPESKGQRKFFEGAVVPMACFFQEKCDHHNSEDLENMRERLKIEFNGDFVALDGRGVQKVGKSTKGALQKVCDSVIDWLEEQYGIDRMEVLNSEKYRDWKNRIFPYGGPETYIDYLLETKQLKK